MQVLEGTFLPTCYNCTGDVLDQGLGLIGAIIMPHNIYLHSGLVLVSFNKHCVCGCAISTMSLLLEHS